MPRLRGYFYDDVVKDFVNKYGYSNVMRIPRFEKITLNMGIGKANFDKKIIDNAISDLSLISGQKPILTKAKKSISSFKIRDGWVVGRNVTLRKNNMY